MQFFKKFYVKFIEWFATFLMNRTNTVLRHLIILKGKDPDFVPPPPAPPAPPPEPVRTGPITLKVFPSSHGNDGSKFVLDARRKFEAPKAAPAPTEIGGKAIEALREAVTNIEQSLDLTPKKANQNKDKK